VGGTAPRSGRRPARGQAPPGRRRRPHRAATAPSTASRSPSPVNGGGLRFPGAIE
jgi:hypothetical protein